MKNECFIFFLQIRWNFCSRYGQKVINGRDSFLYKTMPGHKNAVRHRSSPGGKMGM